MLEHVSTGTDWSAVLNIMLLTNPVGDWFMAGGVMLATMILLNVAQRWLARVIVVPPKGVPATPLRRLIARIIARTHMIFLCGMGIFAGSKILIMPDVVTHIFASIAFIVTALQAAIWLTQVISVAIAHYTETMMETDKDSVTTVNILSLLARAVVWIVCILVVLSNLGVNITAFVASLGIGGVAIALASQKLLGDFFSGLTIVLDKPFGIGDFIVIDNGAQSGTVQQIGVKSTRIRCRTGEDLIISNSKLLDGAIMNHHGIEKRRSTMILQIQHGMAPDVMDTIPEKLAGIIKGIENLDLVRATCTNLTMDGVEFTIAFNVTSGDYEVYAALNQQVLLAIYRLFHTEGIHLARPLRIMEMRTGAATPATQGAGTATS
ncbi:MAG: mechanosensitive ion channel [Proteobacteria bacterium]|nr:mechanosensitive ion channel [Pseudomonadota bacterium]